MIKNIAKFAAAVLPVVAFAMAPSTAMAQSYTGNWPATVSGTVLSNGTYCLTLTEQSASGGIQRGEASWISDGTKWTGQFLIIDGILMVQIYVPEGAGEIGAQVWVAHAHQGKIGARVFGGVEGDDGKVVFGEKNGCSVGP